MFLKLKRCVLILKRNQKCPKPVYPKGEAVERVERCKYLAVVFDSNLTGKRTSELENVLFEKAEIFWMLLLL